jgi:small neutral amino acid transporter SnatA (MarC family)
MSTLLSEIVPLALGAAISPVIFLLQLTTLTGPRPIERGSALTAGAAAALIVVSTFGVLVGDTGFSTRDTLQAAINIALGALLTVVGLRALLRPPKPKAPKTDARPASVRGSLLAGVGGMASNVTRSRSTSRHSR